MGAMSLGRWQTRQFLNRMGATSRLKVTSFGGVCEADVCGEMAAGLGVEVDTGVVAAGCVVVEADDGLEFCGAAPRNIPQNATTIRRRTILREIISLPHRGRYSRTGPD